MAAFDPRALLASALEPGEELREVGIGAARDGRRDAFTVFGGALVGALLVTAIASAVRAWLLLGPKAIVAGAVSFVLFLLGGLFGPGQRAVLGVTSTRVLAAFHESGRGKSGWAIVACPRELVKVEKKSGNLLVSVDVEGKRRVIGLPSWVAENRQVAAALGG